MTRKPVKWVRLAGARALILLVIGVGASAVAAAEEPETEEYSRHGVALFAGVTDDDQETAFSLGLDYEYKLNRRLGIGGLLDIAFGDLRAGVLGVPIFVHPTEQLKLLGAPGFERREGENNFLVRLGGSYVFEVGRVGLAPAFFVDFVDEEEVDVVYIFGLAFEWEF